jgi:lipopolysaccharide/colanic/teichoic acid biosynthesis glycosyltransferase
LDLPETLTEQAPGRVEPAIEAPFSTSALTGRRRRFPREALERFRGDDAPREDQADTEAIFADRPSPANLIRREIRFRRGLGLADLLSAAAALWVSVVLIGNDSLNLVVLLGLPVVVLFSEVIGLYGRDENLITRTTLDEAPALFQLATLYALTIWLLEPLLITGNLGREQVFGLWITLLLLALGFRAAARAVVARQLGPERCVAIGDPEWAERLRGKLAGRGTHAQLVGVVPLLEDSVTVGTNGNGGSGHAAVPSLADLHGGNGATDETVDTNGNGVPAVGSGALAQILRELDAHRVIIASRNVDSDQELELIRSAKALGVRVTVVPRLFEVVGSSVEFDEIQGIPVMGVRRFGMRRSSKLVKRAFDIAGSLAFLIATAPLLAIAAALIKLDSPGPVLFRQARAGRDGGHFQMLKFRTMCDGAEAQKAELMSQNQAEGVFKLTDDPRITRVGRLLRRASIDELPQLWNVLRGEMSLVGPRPLPIDEDNQIEGWRRRRLDLSPGITGNWQILGSWRIPMGEMVKIDYLYVANWSLWTDVKILLRTVPYVLGGRGQ